MISNALTFITVTVLIPWAIVVPIHLWGFGPDHPERDMP